MAIGQVEDVLIAPPAPRAVDSKSTNLSLSVLSLTVKQNGTASRQHRAAWIAIAGIPQPTPLTPTFAQTPSAAYVQAEAQAVASKVAELTLAIRVLEVKVDAIAQAAASNVVQIGES